MKLTYPLVLGFGCWLAALTSSCKKEAASVTPAPALEGTWQADSVHIGTFTGTVPGPTTTLLTFPNTTLVISSTTFSDAGSLAMGGTAANPAIYNYTRNGASVTISNTSVLMQYTGSINALTDNRLQLAFVRPAALGNSLLYQEVFYSR